jgi:hypothetical protein
MRESKAQFTDADVAEATAGLGATKLKPRKARKPQCRVKTSKGYVKGSAGFAVGYPSKTFV